MKISFTRSGFSRLLMKMQLPRKWLEVSIILAAILCAALKCNANDATLQIRVSDNGRFLQYEDGRPFFYLGDTAWELLHKLNREEADQYLTDRARKGFTVIQTVALGELDGLDVPNAYGHKPLTDNDPRRPATTNDGVDYWDNVDYVVGKANSLGLYVGLLPTWGSYWHDGSKCIFDKENAEAYGEFLGRRYRDSMVIWILGGDRNPENEEQKEIIRGMARGLRNGDGGRHLITYHPTGWCGSGQFFHDEEWLDFNMRQNGHETEFASYWKIAEDYGREPVKPVIDGEPLYEDHPVAFKAETRGHSIASDVRRAIYWDLFNGACGHTYGHHSVWQMFDPDKSSGVNNPLMSWQEAIDQPGATQMVYARRLMESRPHMTRQPATDYVLVTADVATAMPGQGTYRFAATGDEPRSYAMIYVPAGRRFTVRKEAVNAPKIRAWWYDPRNGKAQCIGTYGNDCDRNFVSPTPGEATDWILVLDDASKKYPRPGKPVKSKRR